VDGTVSHTDRSLSLRRQRCIDGSFASVSVTRGGSQSSNDKDVKAWLLIGAIFVGTILAVWLPLLFTAMGHG
jgi:hypothetical protein